MSGSEFAPWMPVDTLLARYSMYIDLQLAQTEIDYKLTVVKSLFSESMYNFITLPSNYQSAIDNSVIKSLTIKIPSAHQLNDSEQKMNALNRILSHYDSVKENIVTVAKIGP
ncbi:MAG: penicillin amidase [Alphaproteobacteria bacterium]